jgi:hypothetical protein
MQSLLSTLHMIGFLNSPTAIWMFSNQSYEEVYKEEDSPYQVPTSHE